MVDRRYTDRVRVLKKLCNWGEIATLAQERHARMGDPQSLNDLCWALLLLGRIAEFDVYFKKLAAIAGRSSSSGPQAILRLSAFRAYETRDYENALKRFRQLADIAKTDSGPSLKIADILMQLKRYDEAEQEIAALRRRLGQRDPRLQRLEERIRAKDRPAAQPAGKDAAPGQIKIVLFVPYFEPADPARRREIAACL
jgi:tetratricopeptide (TPR) repeat protein